MRAKEEILLESDVSGVLLDLVYEQVATDLYNKMTTSDLQAYCGAKADGIIKRFKAEVADCRSEGDFEGCLKRKGLL